MAAELVGGAFLSASLQVLFDKMSSGDVLDFIRRKKLDDSFLKKLKIKLLSANSVLNDAEEKQIKNRAVREWLAELKEAICYAEDLMDEIDSEALRCQIDGESGSSSHQVLNLISTSFTAFNKHAVDLKMEEILDRLEFILQQKDFLGLKVGVLNTPTRRTPATSLVEESGVYGRDDDKKAVLDLLLSDEVDSNKVSVIPIVGMGGIGKTTLAQLIYNDDEVQERFDIKAWACVSDDFDVFRITKIILESITCQTCDITDLNRLQERLKQVLMGNKFLFVLDDVWNENYIEWDTLKSPFEFGEPGSKIIVTTRSEKIANMMQSVLNYRLQVMSEDDSWLLFAKHAFGNVETGAHPELEGIGRDIVRKCKGVPLAVKALGGLLRSEQNPQEWERLLKNDIWESSGKELNILPELWLSYYHLPTHLKRCFAYCSIFPKDYNFLEHEIILLWMGENLLEPHKSKTAEEVGKEYFKDLLSRSLFHYTQRSYVTMHDLVNDLAKFVSGESCLRLNDNFLEVQSKSARHLSCLRYNLCDIGNLENICNTKVLRTLLLDKWNKVNGRHLITPEQLRSMQYLRVLSPPKELFVEEGPFVTKFLNSIGSLKLLRFLDFSFSEIEKVPNAICTLYNLQILRLRLCEKLTGLPNSIGNLRCLRYLDLSYTNVEVLPDTICNLHNLHSLELLGCCKLIRLPTNMARLSNLRRLNIGLTNLREMPPRMSSLKCLQKLTDFVVGKNCGSNIKELGELKDLRGYIDITGLENVTNVDDAFLANLKGKKGITKMLLEWTGDIDDSQKAREVLDRLEPQRNLEKLSIKRYGGTSFPDWVGYHSFSRMKVVELSYCKNCYQLPPLGQLPSLKELDIAGFPMVERIGEEFYFNGSSSVIKPFKSLEILKFSDMRQWKEWLLIRGREANPIFSHLKELKFSGSSKLNEACLPDYLPSLTSLEISANSQLVASLPRCHYPSLGILKIEDCPEVKTFPRGRLPSNIHTLVIKRFENLVTLLEEGWPSNLQSLQISSCLKLFSQPMHWNLQMLTSLTSLLISGVDEKLASFPEEGQLPTTLTSLELVLFPNLKSLNGKAFQHLSCLQHLKISLCPELDCLPEGLPASLSLLDISNCPLLSQSCRGKDWPKIAHIPRVYIDHPYSDFSGMDMSLSCKNFEVVRSVFKPVQDIRQLGLLVKLESNT
ncbi:putative disease resistance RPP13-like protein 1 [Ziziphus jujuba]|uniref:Disease resistance RPP13-like protein 1 n=1 Tax=Ziziphus jujuba TaxID=326968 RepID=A0A6P6G6G4_ZIZJJ|nr:putative disease resistance RPP13-like protein 1 [Ziziphus jujuba]XP_024929685.3 putative disease resistance RPP13-like protein 1 [Ziziphus jujuba]XP_024929687.3 putative disease resistance RPP13-like protein 1 [Ziziphus jujuba]XP_024929688.3 putative disease resistance RPP13-like protein 1 [Ziziphus jujuba]XP_024929689.3 putative disease resistance RPP13-like protein 1 [Ziziphus jujuba]